MGEENKKEHREDDSLMKTVLLPSMERLHKKVDAVKDAVSDNKADISGIQVGMENLNRWVPDLERKSDDYERRITVIESARETTRRIFRGVMKYGLGIPSAATFLYGLFLGARAWVKHLLNHG